LEIETICSYLATHSLVQLVWKYSKQFLQCL